MVCIFAVGGHFAVLRSVDHQLVWSVGFDARQTTLVIDASRAVTPLHRFSWNGLFRHASRITSCSLCALLNAIENPIQRYSFVLRVAVGGELGVDRDQIVLPFDFNAVTCIVNQSPIPALLSATFLKIAQRLRQLGPIRVFNQGDGIEPNGFQRLGNTLRVAVWIGLGSNKLVLGHTDHQSDPDSRIWQLRLLLLTLLLGDPFVLLPDRPLLLIGCGFEVGASV